MLGKGVMARLCEVHMRIEENDKSREKISKALGRSVRLPIERIR